MLYVAAVYYDRGAKPNLEYLLRNLSVEDETVLNLPSIISGVLIESFLHKNRVQLTHSRSHLCLFSAGILIVAPFVSSGLCLLLILHMARSLQYVHALRDNLYTGSLKKGMYSCCMLTV